MILTCVYIHVKAESINKFVDVTTTNHKETLQEPGNLRFDLLQEVDDPGRFMLYEAFESEEAAAAHKNTGHYLKWRDNVSVMMAEPRFGVRYNIIQPNDRAKW
jgi:(4S)-4-hydroxy-5-phosphonooxypentane-2,3-dione isomerase